MRKRESARDKWSKSGGEKKRGREGKIEGTSFMHFSACSVYDSRPDQDATISAGLMARQGPGATGC